MKFVLCQVVFLYFYRPQTKLRECNVFTGVCDSVHRGVPAPWGVWPRWGEGACSGGVWSQGVMLGPGGCLVGGGFLLPGVGVPGGDPPRWLLLRAVRILLACILVLIYFYNPPTEWQR